MSKKDEIVAGVTSEEVGKITKKLMDGGLLKSHERDQLLRVLVAMVLNLDDRADTVQALLEDAMPMIERISQGLKMLGARSN